MLGRNVVPSCKQELRSCMNYVRASKQELLFSPSVAPALPCTAQHCLALFCTALLCPACKQTETGLFFRRRFRLELCSCLHELCSCSNGAPKPGDALNKREGYVFEEGLCSCPEGARRRRGSCLCLNFV